jgi:NAD(P)-dependent dehydrogenase (short-subunit alcohol dehydrogenase family)
MADKKTVIVTGASQGIGAAVTRVFLDRGYNVVATSLIFSGTDFVASPSLALVEGDVGEAATAEKVAQTAMATSGDFYDQPRVADAVSDLFRDVFGIEKTSVRLVIGVASLPLGMPVELEVIFEVAE